MYQRKYCGGGDVSRGFFLSVLRNLRTIIHVATIV